MGDRFDERARELLAAVAYDNADDEDNEAESVGIIAAFGRAEHERGVREGRELYRYALSYADSNLTCGWLGTWCFSRAAQTLRDGGDECECTNCRAWRALRGVAIDAPDGDEP